MGAPNTLGNTKAYDDEQALLAAERRGYLRGVEDERARIVAWLRELSQEEGYTGNHYEYAATTLGAKPHD